MSGAPGLKSDFQLVSYSKASSDCQRSRDRPGARRAGTSTDESGIAGVCVHRRHADAAARRRFQIALGVEQLPRGQHHRPRAAQFAGESRGIPETACRPEKCRAKYRRAVASRSADAAPPSRCAQDASRRWRCAFFAGGPCPWVRTSRPCGGRQILRKITDDGAAMIAVRAFRQMLARPTDWRCNPDQAPIPWPGTAQRSGNRNWSSTMSCCRRHPLPARLLTSSGMPPRSRQR